jgi:outer membrane protein assembly factor BamA
MQTVLGDYRRYLLINRRFTLAFRGMHYARYGRDAENTNLLSPLYVDDPQFVRGYEWSNFSGEECSTAIDGGNSCPEFERLVGSRLAVANAEIRIPLFGVPGFGLLNLPFMPVEIAPFIDAGAAWTSSESPRVAFDRTSAERVPVVSAGISTRINLLGLMVFEAYWAHPFQRPVKGSHFGFQLSPGW